MNVQELFHQHLWAYIYLISTSQSMYIEMPFHLQKFYSRNWQAAWRKMKCSIICLYQLQLSSRQDSNVFLLVKCKDHVRERNALEEGLAFHFTLWPCCSAKYSRFIKLASIKAWQLWHHHDIQLYVCYKLSSMFADANANASEFARQLPHSFFKMYGLWHHTNIFHGIKMKYF